MQARMQQNRQPITSFKLFWSNVVSRGQFVRVYLFIPLQPIVTTLPLDLHKKFRTPTRMRFGVVVQMEGQERVGQGTRETEGSTSLMKRIHHACL